MLSGKLTQDGKLKQRINILVLVLLIASIAVFSATDYYFVIAVPFLILFIGWLIVDWKSYYWFYIATIAFTAVAKVGGGYMYLPMMPLSIVSAVLGLSLILYNRKLVYENFYRHPLTLIIFLQFFWLVVSVVFSEIPFFSVKYLGVNIIQLFAFLILPMMALRTEKDWTNVGKIILTSFALVAFYVFVRHAIDGFTFIYSNIAIKPFFYNHVDHGCIMSMMVPLPYIMWRQTDKKKKVLRFVLLGLFLFFIICTYLTFARAAMLALIFSFVVLFAIRHKLVNVLMSLFFIATLSIAAYLIQDDTYKKFRPNYEQTYTRHSFDDLLKATFVGGDMSSAERFYRWIAASRMSLERPFTGVGPNNFYYYYKPNAVQMFRTYVSRNNERSTTHNYFLFMLVEQGWPAMILYGAFVWAIFFWAQKVYHQSNNVLYKRMALLAGMVIAAFFVNNLFSELLQTYKIGSIFYLSLVLIYWIDNQNKKAKKLT